MKKNKSSRASLAAKLALALLVLVLPACAGGGAVPKQQPVSVTVKELLHHNYVLETVDGKPFASNFKTPNLSFGQDLNISGAVCNSFFGRAELKGNVLSAPQLASTLMLCPDPQLNRLEADFAQMLREGAELSLEGERLYLRRDGRELGYRLRDYVN